MFYESKKEKVVRWTEKKWAKMVGRYLYFSYDKSFGETEYHEIHDFVEKLLSKDHVINITLEEVETHKNIKVIKGQ